MLRRIYRFVPPSAPSTFFKCAVRAESSAPVPAKATPSTFKRVGRVEPTHSQGKQVSNPYSDFRHFKWQHLALAMAACFGGGVIAGQFAELNEDEAYKPRFDFDHVMAHYEKCFELRPDLAATILRLVFVLSARRAGVTADAIEESCAVGDGLEDATATVNYGKFEQDCSAEDIIAIGAIAAIKFLKGPYLQLKFNWNRDDRDKARPRIQPKGRDKNGEPLKMHSIPTIMKAIGQLTTEESVALMGIHGVGEFHDYVSGLDNVSRLPRRYRLGNSYYKAIINYKNEMKKCPVERTNENMAVDELPTDLVSVNIKDKKRNVTKKCVFSGREVAQLVKDPEWYKWVEVFSKDIDLWEKHFASAMQKLLDSNYRYKLRDYEADARRAKFGTEQVPAETGGESALKEGAAVAAPAK